MFHGRRPCGFPIEVSDETVSIGQKLAEHRAQREQQEREIQALREAKFRQFEEWQRQQLAEDQKNEPARRLV